MALQQDIGRQLSGLRRALKPRRRGWPAGATTVAAALAVAGLFAGTLGWTGMNGTLPPFLLERLPTAWAEVAGTAALSFAFALFAAGTAALLVATYLVSATLVAISRSARKT